MELGVLLAFLAILRSTHSRFRSRHSRADLERHSLHRGASGSSSRRGECHAGSQGTTDQSSSPPPVVSSVRASDERLVPPRGANCRLGHSYFSTDPHHPKGSDQSWSQTHELSTCTISQRIEHAGRNESASPAQPRARRLEARRSGSAGRSPQGGRRRRRTPTQILPSRRDSSPGLAGRVQASVETTRKCQSCSSLYSDATERTRRSDIRLTCADEPSVDRGFRATSDHACRASPTSPPSPPLRPQGLPAGRGGPELGRDGVHLPNGRPWVRPQAANRSMSRPCRMPRSLTVSDSRSSFAMTVRTMQAPARMTSALFDCSPPIWRRSSTVRVR